MPLRYKLAYVPARSARARDCASEAEPSVLRRYLASVETTTLFDSTTVTRNDSVRTR